MSEPPPMSATRLEGPDDVTPYLNWLTDILNSGQDIAIDTETGSVTELWTELPLTGRGHCRLYQIGTATEAWAIDAQDWHHLIRHTQELVAKATNRVIFANATYDQSVFRKEGWPVVPWSRVEDVVVAHRLTRYDQFAHGLKPASVEEFGGWAGVGQSELKAVMADQGWDWSTIPTDHPIYWLYGSMDVCLTVLLWRALKPDLPDWYAVEMEYLRLAWDMTHRGVLIDPLAVEKAHEYWTSHIDAEAVVLEQLGFDRPGSSKIVMEVFKELGHEPSEFSEKTGDPSYNKMVLTAIQELGGPLAEAAEHLLNWRSMSAWRNNYGRKLLQFTDSDNLLHPEIMTMEARTGRSSIRNPPLQTIPHHPLTRDMFVAEKGHKLIAVDYAGQEIRVQAALSQDQAMLDFFAAGKQKFHAYVSDMVGIPYDAAKTIVYARSYGASAATMARTAKCSVTAMEGYLREIDGTFPDAITWRDGVTAEAEKRGYEDGVPWVQLPYGRRSALTRGREYTQAANTIIQGHGADVLKLACCRMAQAGLDEFFVLPVHDEVLFSVPEGAVEEVTRLAVELMEDRLLPVPLTTEASGPLDRWGDKYREDQP